MMNGTGKSDSPVVPRKRPNKESGRPLSAEAVEGRGLRKGKTFSQTRSRTQGRGLLPPAGERIRQAAEKDRTRRFTALWHHVYAIDHLEQAFLDLKRQAAPGVDRQTWYDYDRDREENLRDLSDRLKRGAYRAQPVKRTYVPKRDGKQRPIGITTVEDKIVQRATAQILNGVYEADFKNFSHGFRPGRNCHQALDALTVGLTTRKVNWVLDADIQGFFDTINHDWLLKMVRHRIADERVIRHIQKWLKAGVMEEGRVWHSDTGTPQGGSLSPLLANIYLHYVLDLWVDKWRRTQAKGDVIVVRYADDFVVGFQFKEDADRFRNELKERLAQFDLTLHEEKTRRIEFGRFAAERRRERGEGKPETFNFLGFTFICGKTRKGEFQILRKTIRKRMQAKLQDVKEELKRRLHDSIAATGHWLRSVLKGHYHYFGVPLNYHALSHFHQEVVIAWYRTLQRRSQKTQLTWEKMSRIVKRWLPRPRIVHPYPNQRLSVTT